MSRSDLAKSVGEQVQFFRFSCARTGIAEDKAAGPKSPISGFKVTQTASRKNGQFFLHVKKEGFANNGVEPGSVNDTTVKDIQV